MNRIRWRVRLVYDEYIAAVVIATIIIALSLHAIDLKMCCVIAHDFTLLGVCPNQHHKSVFFYFPESSCDVYQTRNVLKLNTYLITTLNSQKCYLSILRNIWLLRQNCMASKMPYNVFGVSYDLVSSFCKR